MSSRHGGAAARCAARSRRSSCSVNGFARVVEDEARAAVVAAADLGLAGAMHFPHDPEMRVSHETIYLSLFVQSRGALRKELTRYLRPGHATRRPLGPHPYERPGSAPRHHQHSRTTAEANDRAVPGHWEGDLMIGKKMSAIATLVERKTRFVMLSPCRRPPPRPRRRRPRNQDRDAARTAAPFAHLGPRQGDGRPRPIQRSTPASPSTSATHAAPGNAARNENTNGLLRQYFPKRTDLGAHPGRPRPGRRRTQRPSSTNPGLAVTIRSARRSVAMTT